MQHLADTKFTALPRYSESLDRDGPGPSTRRTRPPPVTLPPPAVDGPLGSSTPAALGSTDPAVYDRYERLITGQESEMGEAPPAYTATPVHRQHSV